MVQLLLDPWWQSRPVTVADVGLWALSDSGSGCRQPLPTADCYKRFPVDRRQHIGAILPKLKSRPRSCCVWMRSECCKGIKVLVIEHKGNNNYLKNVY